MRLVPIIAVFCGLALAGCGLINLDPKVVVTARVASTDSEALREAIPILKRRLSDEQGALNSSVDIQAQGDTLTIELTGGAPAEDLIRQLIQTRGTLAIREYRKAGLPWITNADIVGVNASFDNQQRPTLKFKTSAEAGRALREKTRSAQGRQLELSIDEKTIMVATIESEFGESFQSSVKSLPEAALYRNLLSGAPLPVDIEVLSIKTLAK